MIDLLYHATIYYEIRKFVQESEPAALTYEMVIEKAKAHERNVLEYKYHQASHGGANSVPSYNNPLLSAHALSKRWPSGCGNNGQCCGKCGKFHERGNCPTYGKTCNKCQGINHFKAICRSKVTAKTAQSPHRSKKSQPQRHGSMGSYSGQDKGGGNRQHQKKKIPKKLPKQKAYAVMFKNSVPSEVTTTSGGEREKHGNVSKTGQKSSSQKKQTTLKTVTSGKAHIPSPRMHSFEDAKLQGRQTATGVRSGTDVDVSDGEQHSHEEPSATTGKKQKTSKSGNSVHSGPNKNITDSVKDSPFSNQTTSNSKAKSGPKMKHTSKKAPLRKYYRPSNDTKTFQINSKGHLQCQQDPKLIHKPNDKGKLPGSREAPIYHEPGTVSCKTVEDLKKLYPNSFDRLGSLKGAYNIQIDPSVKPATHARGRYLSSQRRQ